MDASGEKKMKTGELFEYQKTLKENKIGRKRSNSLTESTTSADESDNSMGDDILSSSLSGTSSPATSAHDCQPVTYDESDDYASLKQYETGYHHNINLSAVERHLSTEWIDLMTLRYIQSNGNYPPSTHHHHQPLFYPHIPPNYESVSFKQPPTFILPTAVDLVRSNGKQMPSSEFSLLTQSTILDQSKKSRAVGAPKKSGFSISAILGCES